VTKQTPVQKERLREHRRRFTKPTLLLQLALVAFLLLAPILFPSFRLQDMAAKIVIFAVVVASFDLILGYSGLLSLGHSMFFGLGAYSLALVIHHSGGGHWYHFILAPAIACGLSIVLAVVIAFFSLRVKAIFFAMMTLALAEFANILAITWYDVTMAEDGVSFKLPGVLDVGYTAGSFMGVELNGRLITYYLILATAVVLFVGMLRFVRSPVGRVLKGIRDNQPRAEALGYKTFRYQTLSIVFSCCMASMAGILYAMWLRYVAPESVLGINTVMLPILLMVIIGGLGTLYGSIVGAAFIKITETWLPEMQKWAVALFPQTEVVHRMAERWILYFGILFILVVFFFPKGFVGTAREMMNRRREAARKATKEDG